MKSMTGFGYSEYKDEERRVSVDLKAYNNRYLDIFINLPQHCTGLEPRLRDIISQEVTRGRVELSVKTRELQEDLEIFLDEKAVKRYADILYKIKKITGVRGRPRLSHLLRMEEVLKVEKKFDVESIGKIIEKLLSDCLKEFDRERKKEGEKTKQDVEKQLSVLENAVATVRSKTGELEEKLKETLRDRFYQLLGEGVDESRIYAETAVLLVKYDVNEEITRLTSHIARFKDILDEENGIGKKLDFICQELNREINTIGSKSTLLEVNQAVIDSKDAIEKIREQLRNIE